MINLLRIISGFYLAFPCLAMESQLRLEVINIPRESNVLPLNPNFSVIKMCLDRTIDSAKQGKSLTRYNKIGFASPEEGKKYFFDYLNEKLGTVEATQIAGDFFSEKFFLGPEEDLNEMTPEECIKDDPYVLTHINNMVRTNCPGREGTMEEAKKRWGPKIHFLSPEEAFNGYVNHSFYKNYLPKDFPKSFQELQEKHPDLKDDIFSSNYFGLPADEEERKRHFLNYDVGFLTHELLKSIYNGAKKMMRLSHRGDTFVIFGNTPYFVGRTLSHLCSENPMETSYRKIINFPFSGSPNKTRENSFLNLKDMVTIERLEHLKKRMKKAGLSPENQDLQTHRTHFVDVIASGSGAAYIVEELLRDFMQAELPFPDIDIYAMNKINIENEEDARNASIADQNANDGESIMVTFPSKEEPHFRLPLHVTYVKGHGLLDNKLLDDWRVFPHYNPYYWQDQFDFLLEKDFPKHIKTVFDYFDTNIQEYMKQE